MKTDLLDVFVAIAENKLNDIQLEWSDGYSVCVVMASEGYPGDYPKGREISGIQDSSDSRTFVYHAGTKLTDAGDLQPMVGEYSMFVQNQILK